MSKKRQWFPLILLFLIILTTSVLRFYELGKVPGVLTRDEAAVGYNAYSILKTGKDEFGVKFPLWFLSFGDYKNPLYIYLSIPFIKAFGLNEFSVRFLSALTGSLTVIAVYFLLKELLKTTNIKESKWISLLSAFFLAVSPWHIFYSRMVYESILALFLVVSGILFLLKAREKKYFLLPSLICFILSFFTYNPPIFILPILIPVIFILFKEAYFKKTKIAVPIFLLLFYLSLAVYFILSKNLIIGRSESTIFSKTYLDTKISQISSGTIKKPFNLNYFSRKKSYIVYNFFSNYISVFNYNFLFKQGDGHLWHGLGVFNTKIGNLYLIFLPLFLTGLFFCWKIKNKEMLLLIFWLLISPVACSLTQDAPNTTRLNDFLLVYIIISSFGFYFIQSFVRKFNKYLIPLIFLIIISINLYNFIYTYLNIFPRLMCEEENNQMWLCGIKDVIKYSEANKKNFRRVFIVTPTNEHSEPYIQYAFYLKIDPKILQDKATRVRNYFLSVGKINNYYFNEVQDKVKLVNKADQLGLMRTLNFSNSLLITKKNNNLTENFRLTKNKTIYNNLGQPLWYFYKIN